MASLSPSSPRCSGGSSWARSSYLEVRIRAMIPRPTWGGLALPNLDLPHDVVILGLPFDGGACWRSGAAEAPRRLREISASSPAISEEGHAVDPGRLRVRDAGDIAPEGESTGDATRQAYFSRIEEAVVQIFKMGAMAGRDAFLLSIGGDHSVSIPLVRGFGRQFPEGFGLVLLDAHPDLFDTYDGSPLSSACPMRRGPHGRRPTPGHLLILGTRSYNQVELDFMQEKGIRFVPAREIARLGVESVVALARQKLDGVGNVYVSLDIDVADPSCAPGTGAPVAGGLSSRQLLDLARGLAQHLPVRAMRSEEHTSELQSPCNLVCRLLLEKKKKKLLCRY